MVEMERCNYIGTMLIERNHKVMQRLKEQDPRQIRIMQTHAQWITSIAVALAFKAMWYPVLKWKATISVGPLVALQMLPVS